MVQERGYSYYELWPKPQRSGVLYMSCQCLKIEIIYNTRDSGKNIFLSKVKFSIWWSVVLKNQFFVYNHKICLFLFLDMRSPVNLANTSSIQCEWHMIGQASCLLPTHPPPKICLLYNLQSTNPTLLCIASFVPLVKSWDLYWLGHTNCAVTMRVFMSEILYW